MDNTPKQSRSAAARLAHCRPEGAELAAPESWLCVFHQQLVSRDAKDLAQLNDFLRVWEGLASLPAADRLAGDTQLCRQRLLGETGSPPPEGDFFTDGHGQNSFLRQHQHITKLPGSLPLPAGNAAISACRLLSTPASGPPAPPEAGRRRNSPDRRRSGPRFRRRCSPGSCCRRRGG